MATNTQNTITDGAGIRCVEIVTSRKAKSAGEQYLWPLSVYSLENHAVAHTGAEPECEVFHFMVYDWERTIENLLLEAQVPYAITQYFTVPARACSDFQIDEPDTSRYRGRNVDTALHALR